MYLLTTLAIVECVIAKPWNLPELQRRILKDFLMQRFVNEAY